MRLKRQKFLITFIGPIGSGKTHVALRLAKSFKSAHIRTDDIRVRLGKEDKPFTRAPLMANQLLRHALAAGKSVIADFDAVRPERRQSLKNLAKRFGARFILIKIVTPEKLLLARLKKKRYITSELFRDARHAIQVYFIRKKFHERLRRRNKNLRPNFVINNARPLAPQIKKVVKNLKGL
ncbi:MAG: hypothetical protein A3C07_01410 [Candidatus Sungbacteria bacterium RIFCSPHIGHO2_02_FULL_47_11]|uniref:Uncharacterized protein n=1 Tax=Candidatus Sungbacteria bacterium RIFCSPHIGHO2_02_FULL_47_11 TaxID=1802270 RepID=A0A1G2KM18_9BACT|nr:MAG: hypothetical protein A3C07_01410 [Candidatus Sungbacteria bacterium RIFCSPHIGHO2_02_FULL_47_11]